MNLPPIINNENNAGEDTPVRLQVYLSHSGAASRRAAEKLISEGRVKVNGVLTCSMGVKVFPSDVVQLDGIQVKLETRFHYLALNKPSGYLCASSDPHGRQLALELLPPLSERLYNVGRLDYLSSGLILFTNDGSFAAKIGHPSSNLEKEYIVQSTVPIPAGLKDEFLQGINIDSVFYKALEYEQIDYKTIRVILTEGKNREIRRIFSHFHLHPKSLKRIRIGPVLLGSLKEGKTRGLTRQELDTLLGV